MLHAFFSAHRPYYIGNFIRGICTVYLDFFGVSRRNAYCKSIDACGTARILGVQIRFATVSICRHLLNFDIEHTGFSH